jgi:hypothetical protein
MSGVPKDETAAFSQPPRQADSPGVADYQDTIHHWVTTIGPDGCAPARREHSVHVISKHPYAVTPDI